MPPVLRAPRQAAGPRRAHEESLLQVQIRAFPTIIPSCLSDIPSPQCNTSRGIPCNLNRSAKVVRRPRAVESQSCAVPSQAWGYAGRPASLGATHAHNNDDIIAAAVQPGCFHLRECLRKMFLSSRGSCRQALELGLPNIQAYRPGSNKRASGGARWGRGQQNSDLLSRCEFRPRMPMMNTRSRCRGKPCFAVSGTRWPTSQMLRPMARRRPQMIRNASGWQANKDFNIHKQNRPSLLGGKGLRDANN